MGVPVSGKNHFPSHIASAKLGHRVARAVLRGEVKVVHRHPSEGLRYFPLDSLQLQFPFPAKWRNRECLIFLGGEVQMAPLQPLGSNRFVRLGRKKSSPRKDAGRNYPIINVVSIDSQSSVDAAASASRRNIVLFLPARP